jgi:hypothetical protein
LQKTPCKDCWAGGGGAAGPLGPSWAAAKREERGKKRWAAAQGREKRVSPLFFWFSFLSLFKFKFQLSFEFCLNSEIAKE